jgi:hypothetical protein
MNGATIVPEMTELRPRPSASGSAAKIRPRIRFTASRISHARTSVPNTCQPRPRTSWWLRPKDAITPDCSSTMTGMITAQMVIRYRPGTMIRISPIVMAMPARIEAPATAQKYGVAARTVSPRDRSARPSRTSCTALTSVACNRNAATISTREPSSAPMVPPASARSAAMTAAAR